MIDISKYTTYHQASIEKHKKERAQAIQDALKASEKILSILKKKLTVRRVILFGSLKNGTFIKNRSDIDIAVEATNAMK